MAEGASSKKKEPRDMTEAQLRAYAGKLTIEEIEELHAEFDEERASYKRDQKMLSVGDNPPVEEVLRLANDVAAVKRKMGVLRSAVVERFGQANEDLRTLSDVNNL